ncbi:MAG: SH3 domain-containing protein [Pseudonocardiaceae bacterium]
MAISKPRLWIIGGALVVGALVLNAEREGDGGDGQGCEVEVTVDRLNVRAAAGPEHPVVDQLRAGDTTAADPVTENGFRRLGEGRWAAAEFLVPTDGSDCGVPSPAG